MSAGDQDFWSTCVTLGIGHEARSTTISGLYVKLWTTVVRDPARGQLTDAKQVSCSIKAWYCLEGAIDRHRAAFHHHEGGEGSVMATEPGPFVCLLNFRELLNACIRAKSTMCMI
jgi:hypothetical protein